MQKKERGRRRLNNGKPLKGVVFVFLVLELAARHLCVLDVQGFPLRRQWYLVQRQGKRLSPAAQAFAQFVLSEAVRVAPLDTLA